MTDSARSVRLRNSTAEFLIFTAQVGEQSIEARYEDETIWLTQKLMAELFATTRENINQHLATIYQSEELSQEATCKNFLQVRQEGTREVQRSIP
jgi:hypothetical protein